MISTPVIERTSSPTQAGVEAESQLECNTTFKLSEVLNGMMTPAVLSCLRRGLVVEERKTTDNELTLESFLASYHSGRDQHQTAGNAYNGRSSSPTLIASPPGATAVYSSKQRTRKMSFRQSSETDRVITTSLSTLSLGSSITTSAPEFPPVSSHRVWTSSSESSLLLALSTTTLGGLSADNGDLQVGGAEAQQLLCPQERRRVMQVSPVIFRRARSFRSVGKRGSLPELNSRKGASLFDSDQQLSGDEEAIGRRSSTPTPSRGSSMYQYTSFWQGLVADIVNGPYKLRTIWVGPNSGSPIVRRKCCSGSQIVDWLVSYIQRHPLFAEKASEIGRDNAVRLAGKLLQAGVITRISTPASNNDESDSSLHFKDTPSALYDVDSSRALQINED